MHYDSQSLVFGYWQFFHPIGIEDLKQLETSHVETPAVPALASALAKEEEQSEQDPILPCLQSFPLSQRITAAFLDEGKGHATASKVRPVLTAEDTWMEGPPDLVHQFNRVWDDRLRFELEQVGLLDPQQDDGVLTEIRLVCYY